MTMPGSSKQPPPASPSGADDITQVRDARAEERNRILRALPPGEYSRIAPNLEHVSVKALQILADSGEDLQHVYFPEAAIVSVARRMEDGSLIEAGTIGREGMAGLAVALGDSWSPAVLQGQVPGPCKRMRFAVLREMLPELAVLSSMLRRFTLSFLDQLGQAVACNAVHSVEQRCARWLLMTHDRVGGDEFELTHQVLAQMLAVRRASVSEVASAFQKSGVIAYSRGRMVILQRAGLEAAVCECYGILRANSERILGSS
jgi:CRP-like cAMP-binding protein